MYVSPSPLQLLSKWYIEYNIIKTRFYMDFHSVLEWQISIILQYLQLI